MADKPQFHPDMRITNPDGRASEEFARLLLLLLVKIDALERRIAALE